MKKLWEFFEPRNKNEFFGILADYEAQGYTVGIGEKEARLFVFNANKFFVMLVKGKQFGKYDYTQGGWFVTAITHAAVYDPNKTWIQIQPPVKVIVPYPTMNILQRINIDPVDVELFNSFIKEYITLPNDKRLRLGRGTKFGNILDKKKKGLI